MTDKPEESVKIDAPTDWCSECESAIDEHEEWCSEGMAMDEPDD